MTVNKPASAVPELRFPEFRDAPEWAKVELGQVADFVSERIRLEQLTLANYVSTENILPNYEGLTTASKLPSSGSATRFKVNDILVSNIRPYLKKIWFSNKDGGTSNDVIVVRAKEAIIDKYLSFIIKNDAFIEHVMKGAQGVKMPRGDIAQIRDYPLTYPSDMEQQKIADCLGSLDDLIAAEGRKLEALRQHKQGLMQQLFPRPGETLPRLRFPEFRNAEAWDVYRLGEIADYENGKAYEKDIVDDGRFIVVNARFISTDGAVRKYTNETYCIAQTGDVLIVLSDLPSAKALARCFLVDADETYAVNQRVARLRPNSVDSGFLLYVLDKHPSLMAFSDGINQTHLSKGAMLDCPLVMPRDNGEQQRIADSLTTIDDQLDAQARKLDTLKQHKRALLQQLFPSLEGNEQ